MTINTPTAMEKPMRTGARTFTASATLDQLLAGCDMPDRPAYPEWCRIDMTKTGGPPADWMRDYRGAINTLLATKDLKVFVENTMTLTAAIVLQSDLATQEMANLGALYDVHPAYALGILASSLSFVMLSTVTYLTPVAVGDALNDGFATSMNACFNDAVLRLERALPTPDTGGDVFFTALSEYCKKNPCRFFIQPAHQEKAPIYYNA